MKTSLCLISILVLAVSVISAQDDPGSIRNFVRVNEQFCTGGQPRMEHLEKLKSEGVKAIINLRRPTEHRAEEEEAKAKELGLRYFNIPVATGDPKDEQADEFLKITDDPANRPAFIHCTAAVRVGAFWMIRRVLRDGWKIEDAEAEAQKIGLREHPQLNEFARKYIEKHQKKAAASDLPRDPMKFGAFTARFDPGGTFSLEGERWPKLNGNWKKSGDEMELTTSGGPGGCDRTAKYR
ncbi:MAG TPA: protein tyrosine phosphatase family protein, partial [Pyrinomonadaceae bacterium]|nr:protein tyrosine phosphatase family protein [Pyrinomonadaceae bacterium]